MSALEIANSAPMWIACGVPVLLVMIQSILFIRKAYKSGPEIGVTEDQMKKAMKSSAITAIGPSVVILSGMLSLLVTVGGPIAWMRLSMIGSVMFESLAAGIGTQTVGVTLGTDVMTNEALAMAIWTMVLCSIGWVLFATFSATRMDMVQNKLAGGDTKKLITISTCAVIGVFAAMSAQHLTKSLAFAEGKFAGFALSPNTIACVLGGVFMGILMTVSKKYPKLKEWNLTISILAAMIITAVIAL